MTYFFLDLESRSELDVTKVGSYAYWAHPSSEILCAAWARGDDEVRVATPLESSGAWPLELLRQEPGTFYVAHNIDFERNALRQKLGVDVPLERWVDTAALAARMSLPRNLEELGEFFFPAQPERWKDMEGNRVMKKLARPRRPSSDNPDKWWTPATKPEDFQRLYAYCAKDVELMRDVLRRLLPLDDQEQRVWLLTERMNQRGVKVDLESIPPAQAFLSEHGTRLAHEFRELLGCSAKAPVKVAAACGLTNVKKGTVRKALREPALEPRIQRALVIHRQLARSSTSKLAALLRRVSGDGRLRGSLNYSGAERTGRWSSMGVQLQNLPRGLGKQTDLAFTALHAGVLDEAFTGMERPHPDKPLTPMDTPAEMLRGFLVGPFLVGDKAQIEARTLAWLAGQDDLVEVFRQRGDPYSSMASKIYGHEVKKGRSKQDDAERFMGKQVVLGCGYGLGHRGFRSLLDETYDVAISEEFARRVIKVYRKANPRIVKFWELLERGMKFAILNRSRRVKVARADGGGVPLYMGVVEVAGILYAYIELPSGRKLYYARPAVKGDEIRYFGRDIRLGGAWTTIHTYGGKIAENVTQAVSRDALAEAMLRLYDHDFDLVLTVHDEVVAEDHGEELEEFKQVMEEVPTWARGLPIEVECFKTVRYRK